MTDNCRRTAPAVGLFGACVCLLRQMEECLACTMVFRAAQVVWLESVSAQTFRQL